MQDYKFDPTKYGYEPIAMFPELGYMFNMENKTTFVKVIEYANYAGLVYWYSAIHMPTGDEDRIKIISSSHDTRQPAAYEKQNKHPRTTYHGLISSESFAETLLPHIFGTTKNSGVKKYGIERLKSRRSEKMRIEFPNYNQ